MRLRQEIFDSIERNGRNIHELSRNIALLTPEDSDLFPASNNFYLRTGFGPPEADIFYLSVYMEDFDDYFKREDWKDWPWYAKAIALLISGGRQESDEIFGEYNYEDNIKSS